MDKLQHTHLIHIQEAAKQGRLVIFAGAGISNNSGVPTWSELTKEFKKECGIENETDDLKIAQLYMDARGKKEYLDKVKSVLKHHCVIPNDIHKAILDLKPCHIITTNYDDLFEQEIQNEYKQYSVVRRDGDIPKMSYPNALIKMHGDFDSDNIVLTESDYFNYSKTFPLIRSFVLSLFASKLVVFVGFSFADLNLKMILNELQSNLQGEMQRAYLIADAKPDHLTSNYYENKGINIVYLEKNDLEVITQSSPANLSSSLKHPKGVHLYQMLQAIRLVKKDMNKDLASRLFDALTSYSDEIKVFGDGIKYFIPEDERPFWYMGYHSLQIGSPFFKSLGAQLKSFDGRKRFVKEHPDINFRKLVCIAKYNHLYRIDEVDILNERTNLDKYFDGLSAIGLYYKLGINNLIDRLKSLSTRELSCDISDLEYPFILYQLGDYYQAYQRYKDILPLAWNKQKYILYFICLYNIWSIRYGIRSQLMLRKDLDGDTICEKISKINLDEVLNKLPITEEIRSVFQDLLSYRGIGQQAVEVEKLKDKIHQQRKLSERGGFSLNSNVLNLIGRFEREFSFCNDNFIVYNNNRYFNSICLNTAAGILNSYATPDGRSHESLILNSKLDTILPIGVFIFIFQLSNKELKELFEQYEVYSIRLSEEAVEKINIYLSNLDEAEELPYASHYSNILNNLFYVVSKSENDTISTTLLYDVLLKYWNTLNAFQFNEYTLLDLLKQHKPSPETLCKLLDELIKSNCDTPAFTEIIYTISDYLHKDNICYTSFSASCFQDIQKANNIFPLYNVIEEGVKPDFAEFCTKNITNVIAYLNFIFLNELPVVSVEKFKEMLSKIAVINVDNRVYCCRLLAKMYFHKKYEMLKPVIEDYSNKHESLKFFLSPCTYSRTDNVQVLWITLLDDITRKELMKDDRYRNIVKVFLKKNYLTPWKKDKYIDLL